MGRKKPSSHNHLEVSAGDWNRRDGFSGGEENQRFVGMIEVS